jgi:hypothetical protein
MMLNRRAFSATLIAGTAASLISTRSMSANPAPTKARNVVLVHGLFADGSCWSEVIGRLQAAGLNATAVQNPLTGIHFDGFGSGRHIAPGRTISPCSWAVVAALPLLVGIHPQRLLEAESPARLPTVTSLLPVG